MQTTDGKENLTNYELRTKTQTKKLLSTHLNSESDITTVNEESSSRINSLKREKNKKTTKGKG